MTTYQRPEHSTQEIKKEQERKPENKEGKRIK